MLVYLSTGLVICTLVDLACQLCTCQLGLSVMYLSTGFVSCMLIKDACQLYACMFVNGACKLYACPLDLSVV